MSTRPDFDRTISAWLIAEAPERAPERLLEASRERIRSTRQRRSWWPARRFDMNDIAKLAIGVAAVAVVAIVGINLLPTRDAEVGGPAASPSASFQAPPSPSGTSNPGPSPTAAVGVFPPAGPVPVGKHDAAVLGVPFTFEIPVPDWTSSSQYRGVLSRADGNGWIAFWSPDHVYSDPCTQTIGPTVGPSAADLATAIAAIPGISTTGPTDVTLGGLPAKVVEVAIPADIGCPLQRFLLWSDDGEGPRWPSAKDYMIRVWIVDAGGKRVVVDADMARDNAIADDQIEQIVESIQFE